MTDRLSNDQRQALIAGPHGGRRTPDVSADLELLCDLLADPATWSEPSTSLEDAVVQAITYAERPSVAPVTAHRAAVTQLRTKVARRGRKPPPLAVIAAIAAVAAVALILGTALVRAEPEPAFKGRLVATSSARGGRASMEMYQSKAGFRVSLDAHGLPRLPGGQYYQAWLQNPAGTLVPLGTFSSSAGPITLWSGVSASEFPTATITIEPNADHGRSGRRVLVGNMRRT